MKNFLKILVAILAVGISNETEDVEDCETSVFCYGRLLHDVQIHELFKTPSEFLELRARHPHQVITEKYRDLRRKLKLSLPDDRQKLKSFILNNFENRSCCEITVPIDWSAQPPLRRIIKYSTTLDFYRILNRQWIEMSYDLTLDARKTTEFHSTLPLKRPFFGSSGPYFNYEDSWWVYQGLIASGMVFSARLMIENLSGLVNDYGYVPPVNRVYFLGRSSPPFFAIILEHYLNLTGDVEFVKRHLPFAELDFHRYFRISMKKITSAFDAFLVVQERFNYVSQPRPERYKEDWMETPVPVTFAGISVASIIWGLDPPQGIISLRSVSIAEWSARALSCLCERLGFERKQSYSLISWELLHTMDDLLFNKKNMQWMDYSPLHGHVNNVSLWPVYTGVRTWKNHYKVVETSKLENSLVAVDVLKKAGVHNLAEKLTTKALEEASQRATLTLKQSSVAIVLLSRFPSSEIPKGVIVPRVHVQVYLIAVPMMFVTFLSISFLLWNAKISI